MTVNSNKEKLVLKLQYDGGLVDGRARLINKSYSRLNLDADDQNILKTAQLLSSLKEEELVNVYKLETSSLKD